MAIEGLQFAQIAPWGDELAAQQGGTVADARANDPVSFINTAMNTYPATFPNSSMLAVGEDAALGGAGQAAEATGAKVQSVLPKWLRDLGISGTGAYLAILIVIAGVFAIAFSDTGKKIIVAGKGVAEKVGEA